MMKARITMPMPLRPDLEQTLRECRQSMTALKVAVHAVDRPPRAKRRFTSSERLGEEVRVLDRVYTEFTGAPLKSATAPAYCGPLYEWKVTSEDVRKKSLAAVERVRRHPVGLHSNTVNIARHYFASIWPEGAAWPDGIERPDTG